nr:GAP family protein [Arthrobacter sp. zg-Y895]
MSIVASLVSFALAGALSSVPVSITIMILLSPTPRRGALPFLSGSLAGSIAVVGLSAAGLRFLPARPTLDQVAFPAFLGILAGAALVIYALYLFRTKPKVRTGRVEKLRTRLESARVWEFAALGAGMNLRPKAVLLAVSAGALIGVRNLPPVEATVLVLAYAVVAQSAVVVPITTWLRSPDRSRTQLAALSAWLQRKGRSITAAAALAIGVFLAGYNLLQL